MLTHDVVASILGIAVFLAVAVGPWVVGGVLGYFLGSRQAYVPVGLLAVFAARAAYFRSVVSAPVDRESPDAGARRTP